MDKQLLIKLAELRKTTDILSNAVKIHQQELETSSEYQLLQNAKELVKTNANEIEELTAKIKTEALEEYKITKEKPTLSGLALRINHPLKYDLIAVTEWAKENAKMLFKLDVKAFEKMAANTPIPGVEIVEEPTITIATDLRGYLIEL